MNTDLRDSFQILKRLNFEISSYQESAAQFEKHHFEDRRLRSSAGYLIRAANTLMILKVQCFIDEYRGHLIQLLRKEYGDKFQKDQKRISGFLKSITTKYHIEELRHQFIAHGFRSSRTGKSALTAPEELIHIKSPVEADDKLFVKKCIHEIGLILMEIEEKVKS